MEDDPHAELMAEMTDFLQADLQHLFDGSGIDASKYERSMEFQDPLTRHTTLQGYLFNIQFLRRVFSPVFRLHGIKRTGPLQLTTRWTMDMRLAVVPPLVPWDPTLVFTGVSILDVDPVSRKLCRHVDLWDSVHNNAFLSPEAVSDLFGQLLAGVGRRRRHGGAAAATPERGVTLLRRSGYSIVRSSTSGDAAVAWFTGDPATSAATQCAERLAAALRRDGVRFRTSDGGAPQFSVQADDDGAAAWAARHEVRIPLVEEFQLPWTL